MLSRTKIYHKVEVEKDVKKIYIFCEGDREVNYFTYFEGFSSNIDIIPIPNDNGKSDPKKLYEDAILKLFGNNEEKSKLSFRIEFNDEVWFVIDTDRWNEGGKIEALRANCLEQTSWKVCQSNPCFELWLYYHFHQSKPMENETQKFDSFKTFVDYQITGGFDNRKHPILFQEAILNSENNFENENNQPKYLSTEVHVLAKSILPFIKEIIDQCLQLLNKK
jgi:RloB-like protein